MLNKSFWRENSNVFFFSVEVSYLVKLITLRNENWSPKEMPKWCEKNAKSPIVFKRNLLGKITQPCWTFSVNVPHFKQCRKSIRQTQCTFHWTIYFVDLPPLKISSPIVLGVGNTFLVNTIKENQLFQFLICCQLSN